MSSRVTSNTIAEHVKKATENKATPGRGLLRGAWAQSQYRTFINGDLILDNQNAKVRLRKWKHEEYGSSTARDIAICRTGMWIARNEAPKLLPRDFADSQPFQCVISVKNGSDLARLVMDAEGPEHIGLAYLKEMPDRDRQKLRKIFGEIAEVIRQEAGKISDSEEFVLPDFAVLGSGKVENAERLPDRPERLPQLPPDEPNPVPPPIPPEPKPFSDRPFANCTVSMTPVDENGKASKLLCSLEIDPDIEVPEKLGFRVSYHGGSDATCDSWLPSSPLKIDYLEWQAGSRSVRETEVDEGLIFADASHSMELEIGLSKIIDIEEDANALKLEALRRIQNKVAEK